MHIQICKHTHMCVVLSHYALALCVLAVGQMECASTVCSSQSVSVSMLMCVWVDCLRLSVCVYVCVDVCVCRVSADLSLYLC